MSAVSVHVVRGRETRPGMKQMFLRRPVGVGMYVADALRVLGLVSVLVAAIGWGGTAAGAMGLVLIGLVLPRFIGVAPPFDIGLGVVLLVAGWSSVVDLYGAIWFWDLVVHFAAGGAVAAGVYLLLAFLALVPPPDDGTARLTTVLVLTVSFGLATGALWEMLEWLGTTYVDVRISVGYNDTISDMVLGGMGSLAAGFALKYANRRATAGS